MRFPRTLQDDNGIHRNAIRARVVQKSTSDFCFSCWRALSFVGGGRGTARGHCSRSRAFGERCVRSGAEHTRVLRHGKLGWKATTESKKFYFPFSAAMAIIVRSLECNFGENYVSKKKKKDACFETRRAEEKGKNGSVFRPVVISFLSRIYLLCITVSSLSVRVQRTSWIFILFFLIGKLFRRDVQKK